MTGELTDKTVMAIAEQCKRLEVLNVEGCHRLTAASLREIALQCPALNTLNIGGCDQVKGAGVVSVALNCPLGSLTAWKCTELTDNNLIDVATHCRALTTLDVEGCTRTRVVNNAPVRVGLTDTALVRVAEQCPQLAVLNVSNNHLLSDRTLEALTEHCEELSELRLDECMMGEDALAALKARRGDELTVFGSLAE